MTRETDARSIAGKAPRPERHVPVVVVGAGVAGVAAAIEAARAGASVLLVDENPVDNDMMAMDVPLYFGQRVQPSVRNRALMMERVVDARPELAQAHEAGVDVQLGTYVWGAFVNGATVQALDGPMLGLADDRRSWLVGYDRLIVAAGARDVVMGFPGWERAGVMGANAAFSLLARYRALASQRMVIVGSGDLALGTATLALERGVVVTGVIEVGDRVRGDEGTARALAERGVPFYTCHTVREARGRVGEVESVVLVRVDENLMPVLDSEKEIVCDTVCLALGLAPNVELLHLVGARLAYAPALGGWIPEVDEWMRTSVPTVFAVGDCAGFHDAMLADPDLARSHGRLAGNAAALQSRAPHAESRPPRTVSGDVSSYWQSWLRSLIDAGGWDVNVCQCEEVTRRELVGVKPPRYLDWESPRMSSRGLDSLLRDGPVNQDQIKRLTRAGMGPCQGRRCREQVALLLARAAGTSVDRIPLPTFRPPVRPLPLSVLWPTDEPEAMREDWVSWFGIPTQFSPHWTAGMAIAEPTAQARLILSDE
ncbi:MAG TPA: FAD-dependent oxidoreductase [Methylomirabilota bacterium]|jgi:thioredoxin reductase|nr:FAD-dependent oxidoreductase [Methylomirabilota bacterium]